MRLNDYLFDTLLESSSLKGEPSLLDDDIGVILGRSILDEYESHHIS